MPLARLSQLHVGKVDGKYEYIETLEESTRFFDSFLVPETINVQELLSGERFLVRGFRGTGKTSLLRWLAKKVRDEGASGQFVLFKSDVSESRRMEISKQAGIQWAEVNSDKIEVSQDFKEAWGWFLHHKIGEIIMDNSGIARQTAEVKRYLKLLGLTDKPWFERVIGEFPRIEAAKIRVKGSTEFVEAEFEGELGSGGPKALSLSQVLRKLDTLLGRIEISKPLYLYLDELEVFYHTDDQYKRDLRMVRDLIFAADRFVSLIRQRKLPIRICAAIRSEVLDALGSKGQEVSRIVHDCGAEIAWHFAKRGLDHPLFDIIRRRIWASEVKNNIDPTLDPIAYYFPKMVEGVPLEVFMLDQSFYKPRDIVWRLSVAKEHFPSNSAFDSVVLTKTDIHYSSKLWEEVTYELNTMYTTEEIATIESLFSGFNAFFEVDEIADRLRSQAGTSPVVDQLMRRRGIRVILHDLYRLGAIGNSFKAAGELRRHRWVFRGEPRLLDNLRMELHPALTKKLSAVYKGRKRAHFADRVA